MILLACMICLPFEKDRIEFEQPLINRTVQTHCFANALADQGVSDFWINQLQGYDDRLNIYFYREDTNTVGRTNLGSKNIELNRKFHDRYNLCQTGSNIVHELTHTLGFAHFIDVAYAANYAFEKCCQTNGVIN